MEKLAYKGWPNCFRLFNKTIELIVTTDIGPRIVHLGFINGENLFYLVPDQLGRTGSREWTIYGGHRLWHAPEAMPRSYAPDNDRVEYTMTGDGICLVQPMESDTGIVKEMDISLSPHKNEVKVTHRLTNRNCWDVELSVWPISMLAPGGVAIIPQEPYGEGNDYLLPGRSLALWHYTRMNDPRWVWGDKYILAKQNSLYPSEQKIGVTNKQGWTAYYLHGQVLIKRFAFHADALYPDYNCNNETYINRDYLEIETLSPLTRLAPGQTVVHTEHWLLARATMDESEASLDENILPLVDAFRINE